MLISSAHNRPWWLSGLEYVSNSSRQSLGRRFESFLRQWIWTNLYGRRFLDTTFSFELQFIYYHELVFVSSLYCAINVYYWH